MTPEQYRTAVPYPSMVALIKLGTFSTLTEANLVKARLETEGIDALVQSDDFGSMMESMITVRGVQVLVREEDRAAAMDCLERMLPASSTDS